MATAEQNTIWVVVNWSESPETEAGCFGKFFATYDEAWKFANTDARQFKKQNGIEGKVMADIDDGHICLDWCGITHHWSLEQLNKG